jgi:hypothetical protein
MGDDGNRKGTRGIGNRPTPGTTPRQAPNAVFASLMNSTLYDTDRNSLTFYRDLKSPDK